MKLFRPFGLLLPVLLAGGVPAYQGDGYPVYSSEANLYRQDNVQVSAVLADGLAPYPGTVFTVLREDPDAFGKTRLTTIATTGPGADATFRLTPGRYRVQSRNGAVTRDEPITVPEHGHLRHQVVLEAGELQLEGQLSQAGPAADGSWFRVFREDEDPYGRPVRVAVADSGYAPSARFLLPAGRYIAEARFGDSRAEARVEIEPGRATSQTLVFDAGRLVLSSSFGQGETSAPATRFRIFRRHGPHDAPGWLELTETESAEPVMFVLPAGDYRVRAELDLASAETAVSLPAGETLEAVLPLNAAGLHMVTLLSGTDEVLLDAHFDVQPLDVADAGAVTRGPDQAASFILPAGRYRVTARVGNSEQSAELALGVGELRSVVIAQEAGRVTLALVSPQARAPIGDTWFSIYRVEQTADGIRRRRVFNNGYYATANLVLPAGRYIAFARHQAQRGEHGFEVLPGEVKRVSIPAGH